MLQSILQNMIPTMQNLAIAFIPLAILLPLASKDQSGAFKKWIWRGIKWGILGAAFIATVKLGTKAVKREVYEGLVLVLGQIGEMSLLGFLWWNVRQGVSLDKYKLAGGASCIVAAALLLYHGLDFILFPIEMITFTNEIISLEFLMKMIGFLLGGLLTWLTGLAIIRAASLLSTQRIIAILAAQLLVVMAKQALIVVQIMAVRKIFLTTKQMTPIIGPLINHQVWFLYALFAVTLLLPVVLMLQSKPEKPIGLNPAQYRKILMQTRKKMRWSGALALGVCAMFLVSTVGMVYADEKVEIVPAVAVVAEGEQVRIPLEKVDDGHLHRFSYRSSTGETVRFIVIKKSGSAYGVGLDACEICGPTGYFERDNQVVCMLCDVVMNTATIGFKGGCNPIPLEYKVDQGKMIVPAQALEQEKNRFK
ncbi:Fe-S-containing protein [Pelosinus baikalensis]|uniref:Fe-S-containing protein n=1 Tax=Pelosinus baikalensis TaxID=2892015 RepID=A0ABS8HVT3_9FIRM|nr:Fe-S-containing protein [Pelosinus baikalensis]MCC5467270.1 Fe-S-containing protein [Pelosinus baikalensis]